MKSVGSRQRLRNTRRTSSAFTRVRKGLAWKVARHAPTLVGKTLLEKHLEAIAGALEAFAVPYFVVPLTATGGTIRLGVPESWRPSCLAALRALGDPSFCIAPYRGDGEWGRAMSLSHRGPILRRRLRRAATWKLFPRLVDRTGSVVPEYACEIEFWQHDAGGRNLVAARRNNRALQVPEAALGTGSVQIGERSYPTVKDFYIAPHVDEVDFPVDIVYTWVDGSDPAWLERKNATLRSIDPHAHPVDAHDVSRFQNREELRYSLRSLAYFGDFARRIFIVTDDQVPTWLNTDHPKIRMVDHKEIFGAEDRLPTFNSHAIESRLHHIDGLAEHYVYMNDDVFFGRRLTPETFFTGTGASKFFLSPAPIRVTPGTPDALSVDAAAENTRALVLRHFARAVTQKLKHVPHPQRRSVIFEMEEAFPREFEVTASSQFRSPDDIAVASSLYHYYAYLTGRAYPDRVVNRYAAFSDPAFLARLAEFERSRNWDTLCINDVELDEVTQLRYETKLQQFFEAYWPDASSYEIEGT